MKAKLYYLIILASLCMMNCNSDNPINNDNDDPEPVCIDTERTDAWPERLIGRMEFEHPPKDLWGYNDSNTNRDYVLIGFTDFDHHAPLSDTTGVYLVDVTNPSQPNLTATITNIGGWDIKTWDHYMYSVNGSNDNPGKIVDISNPEAPAMAGEFPGAHNIFISDTGLLILSQPGLKIYDLNANPLEPELIWTDGSNTGHEAAMISDILYDFHGFEGTNIYDISEPSNPQLLSTISTESDTVRYHHSGWPTADEDLLVITDERPGGSAGLGPDFTIWDISDKTNPVLLESYRDETSTVHNVHIVNGLAHFAYYAAGYRVFDLDNSENLETVFEFNTAPMIDGQGTFLGAFGVYGLSPSGNVYISDTECGLFVFE